MSIKQVMDSKYFRVVAFVTGIFLIMLASFALGVKVGFYKASFSERFGENYKKNFLSGDVRDNRSGSRLGKMMDGNEKGMRNPHGVAGEIVSISGDTLVIKNPENQESTLRINDKTIINKGKQTLGVGDLSLGESIVVVGKPSDDGVISAKLIRVFKK